MRRILLFATLVAVGSALANSDDPFIRRCPLLGLSFAQLFWGYYGQTIHLYSGFTRIHGGPESYQAELIGRFYWEAYKPRPSYFPAFLWVGGSGSWRYRHPDPNYNDVSNYAEAFRYWDATMPADSPNLADGFDATVRKAQQMLLCMGMPQTRRKFYLNGRLIYPRHVYEGTDSSGFSARLTYERNNYIVQTIYNSEDKRVIPWNLIESNQPFCLTQELPGGGQMELMIGSGEWFHGDAKTPYHRTNPAD